MTAGGQQAGAAVAARLRLPPTVLFGAGCVQRVGEVLLGERARTPLVVTDAGVAATGLPERIVEALRSAGLGAALWSGGRSDPHDGVPELCAEAAAGCDALVAVGGGSVVDTAKVAALLAAHGGRVRDYYGFDRAPGPGLPLVVVATTAGGGSEVSSHAVLLDREHDRKEVVAGDALTPRAAVVDPDLLATAPRTVLLHSALDGLVHAVEGFVARRATPFTDGFVREALPRLVRALPRIVAHGDGAVDPEDAAGARAELALGALYSGFAMAGASAGAAHALGYPLSTRYDLPHGLANALMLPAVVERLVPERPERYGELARFWESPPALDRSDPGRADAGSRLPGLLRAWLDALGIALGLEGHGVAEADLPALGLEASRFGPVLDNTPARLDADELTDLYRRSWPSADRERDFTLRKGRIA